MWRGEAINFSISTRPSPNASFGLPDRALERRVELDMRVDPPHAAPAPAGDRLDQNRIADLVGLLAQELRVLIVAVIAGHDRHASLLHQRFGRAFQAHGPHRRGRRTNEDDPGLGAALGKISVLGQESITRMQALSANPPRKGDNSLLVEIAARALADLVRFVSEPRAECAVVGRRMEDDRTDSHPSRRANDPAGDLAAIGDKDVGEHSRLRESLVYRTEGRMASARLRRISAWVRLLPRGSRCASALRH